MNALETLQGAGVTVELLEGDRLRLSPKAALTEALRELAQAHKAEILARLREPLAEIAAEVEPSAPPTPAPVEADPPRACAVLRHARVWQRPDGGWVCAECHPPVNGELVVTLANAPQVDAGWDPRPDLAADSALWAQLLALAYDAAGGAIDGLFWTLQGFRCCGAGLGLVEGKLKLTAGAMDPDEYARDCTEYLMEHRAAIWELLRRVDVAEEKAA